MKTNRKFALFSTVSLIAASTAPSSALVVMLSDLAPAGSPLEQFFLNNFSDVTEVRHGNFANFATSQDALNGTGAFAGMGAADVFVVGRSLSSGDYDAGDADGYNAINIPFVNLTSYTARDLGNRLGWHTGSANNSQSRDGDETTVSLAGSSILGLTEGAHDLFTDDPNFNGLADGIVGFGDGELLATLGTGTLAAYWEAGDAPGNPTNAGVATFPAPRLLFNLDNEPNTGNDGVNDLTGLTPEGLQALITAIDFATPLTAVPEPTTSLFGLLSLGLLGIRRRN